MVEEPPESGGTITNRLLYCSFCGKGEKDYETLIVSGGDYRIFNKCVDVCNTIISEFRESKRKG